MEDMELSKRDSFYNNFHTVAYNISKRLFDSRAATTNGHWIKWTEFCHGMSLKPLLVSYQDLVPILNTFASQHQRGALAPSRRQV